MTGTGEYVEFEEWPSGQGRSVFIKNEYGTVVKISVAKDARRRGDIYVGAYGYDTANDREEVTSNGFWKREDLIDTILILFPELMRRAE